MDYDGFIKFIQTKHADRQRTKKFSEADLKNAVIIMWNIFWCLEMTDLQILQITEIHDAIDDRRSDNIRNVPFVQEIFRRFSADRAMRRPGRQRLRRRSPPARLRQRNNTRTVGDPDLAVLKKENQNPTRATPFIASLAGGHFREINVIGPPTPVNKDELVERRQMNHKRVIKFLRRAKRINRDVQWSRHELIRSGFPHVKSVQIDKELYRVSMYFFLLCFPPNRQTGGGLYRDTYWCNG